MGAWALVPHMPLEWLAVNHRADTYTQPFRLTFTPMSKSPSLMHVFELWGEPEYHEENPSGHGENMQGFEPGTF